MRAAPLERTRMIPSSFSLAATFDLRPMNQMAVTRAFSAAAQPQTFI